MHNTVSNDVGQHEYRHLKNQFNQFMTPACLTAVQSHGSLKESWYLFCGAFDHQ